MKYWHKGPSIKYDTLFFANFDPLPCHILSHIPGPPKKCTSHISDPHPVFSRRSTKNPDKSPLYIFSQLFARAFVRGSFVLKVLSGVVFVRTPFVRIHLLQQKVNNHFSTLTAGVFITSTR